MLFFLVASAVVVFIIVLFAALALREQKELPKQAKIPIPTEIPLVNNVGGNTQKTIPPVKYDTKKSEELVAAAKNRKTLSENGIATKQKLIASLNNASGGIYSSPLVSIEYIKSPDIFQGKINSTDIASAKRDAVEFMTSQGFTKDDICKLPFSFYLSPSVRNSSEGSNQVFNPLPDGC